MIRLLYWCSFILLISLFAGSVSQANADELQIARQFAAAGKVTEANEAFSVAVTIPHLAADAYYAWYRFLRDQKLDEEAVKRLQSAADLAPDRADWWLELGNYLSQMGCYDEALSRFVSAISIDPRYIAARITLAFELVRREDIPQALVQVNEAISLNPARPQDWMQIITLLKNTEGPRIALATARQIIERWPKDTGLRIVIGQVYELLGETSQAMAEYEIAVKSEPKNALPHLEIARMHYRTMNYKEAEAAYRKALIAQKTSQQAMTGLGWVAVEQENFDACMKQIEALLKVNPDSLDAVTLQGWLRYKQGKRREARKEIEIAAKAVPPNTDALYCLARIAYDTEDFRLYERWLKRCVDTGPGIGPSWRAVNELRDFLRTKNNE